jgi:hypothetical protein
MGFHIPDDMDEIGCAQVKALEAVEVQARLAFRNRLKRNGVVVPDNPFQKPDTDNPFLLGYWEAMQSLQHNLGSVHGGVLWDNRRRKEGGDHE